MIPWLRASAPSVSYTHLDVYKRQAPYTAPGIPADHMTQYTTPETPAETPQAAAFYQETSQTETFIPETYPNAQTPAPEQVPFTEEVDPKAAKKAEKERLKAEKKAEKERLKAEKKAAKERAKAEKAAQKAGDTAPAENLPQADETGSEQQPTETAAEIYTEAASVTAADAHTSEAAVPAETPEPELPNEMCIRDRYRSRPRQGSRFRRACS